MPLRTVKSFWKRSLRLSSSESLRANVDMGLEIPQASLASEEAFEPVTLAIIGCGQRGKVSTAVSRLEIYLMTHIDTRHRHMLNMHS